MAQTTSGAPNPNNNVQGPRGNANAANQQTIYAPIKGSPEASTNTGVGGGGYGAGRDDNNDGTIDRSHAGIDIAVSAGTPCVAPVDGTITMASTSGFGAVGGMIHFRFDEPLGEIPAGAKIGWGHAQAAYVGSGTKVKGGKIIGESGWHHVHFIYQPDGSGGTDGTADPSPVYNALKNGQPPNGVASGGNGLGGAGNLANGESLAKAAAFASFFQLATVAEIVEAQSLTGEKSLMNDKPLFPFVQQLTEASLRNFQSMPNGNFFAFYPDYFGGMGHRTPYWNVKDVEIIDGNMNLSDDALATHVYIVGSTLGSLGASTIDLIAELQSSGVVTIFNAFMLDFLNGTTKMNNVEDPFDSKKKTDKKNKEKPDSEDQPFLTKKDNAIAFLKKYGARPHYEQMPIIRSPYYELFLAYQRFCLLWSQQFSTEFQLTFMPELFPGGIIEFEEHGIQCYIDEVTHNCSYAGGFTTSISVSAPASTVPVGENKNVGMIRAGILARKEENK